MIDRIPANRLDKTHLIHDQDPYVPKNDTPSRKQEHESHLSASRWPQLALSGGSGMSAAAPLLQAKRTWPGLTAAGTDQKLDWIMRAVREFEITSTEDPIAVADIASA